MIYDPNEKGIMESWFTAPVEMAWIYEILFYQVVIVVVKDKNRCTIKDTMLI